MKSLVLVLAFALLGCSSTTPRHTKLSSTQAGILAQKLANENAQAHYNCQPFRDSQPAQFVNGHWVWHDLRGHQRGDLQANVMFAADGANPKVTITLLDSRQMTHEY